MDLPYLTPDFPGITGTLKARPQDFFVQEIPLYEPSGQGEHVYAEIQKVGLTTFDAITRISKALNVSPRGIGYAGMKDAQAVTRQTFSIFGTSPEKVMALKIPGITIGWAIPHVNKLRLGHLKANRFAIRLRDVNPTDVVKLQPVLKTIQQRGLPNYFGEQRFGRFQVRGGARYIKERWEPTGGAGFNFTNRFGIDCGLFSTSANLERRRHLAIAFSLRFMAKNP